MNQTIVDPSVQVAPQGPFSADELEKINAYWRAANYLSVGQIYLLDNPLLREPLELKHVKPRLLGHWGTTPGLNFIYVHMNRVIKRDDLNVINTYNRFVYSLADMMNRLTEPLLRPIRNFLPNLGGIDISPVILILLISFLRSLLHEYAGYLL